MIWYELWDMDLEMLMDEADDPALILDTLMVMAAETEPDERLNLLLIERHPALQAESTFTGADVLLQLEKRVAAQEARRQD